MLSKYARNEIFKNLKRTYLDLIILYSENYSTSQPNVPT